MIHSFCILEVSLQFSVENGLDGVRLYVSRVMWDGVRYSRQVRESRGLSCVNGHWNRKK